VSNPIELRAFSASITAQIVPPIPSAIPAPAVPDTTTIPSGVLAHAVQTVKTASKPEPSTFTLPNGDIYTGPMKGGKPHGKGIVVSTDASIYKRYEGEFVDGKRQGKGTQSYQDGSIYEGDWEKDQEHGQGMWSWVGDLKNIKEKKPQSILYVGSYMHGKRNGGGKETAFYPVSNCSAWKKGTWRDDEFYEGYYLDPYDWAQKQLVQVNSTVTYTNYRTGNRVVHL
jgi:hypothetical protein